MEVGVVSTPELAKRMGSELLCAHLPSSFWTGRQETIL